ncbi:MAG: zinc ribbon domain-containing protein [Candidatus Abawacabacteria bacterium]|nr:zinc ribbon domain-containing protein [Candidatus Abawacabacteria bacterium]
METKFRCQSCGMPLGEGFWGSNEDNSHSQEYCKYCFQKGEFVIPKMTINDMINTSVDHMTKELHMNKEEAQKLAQATIPSLKRWRK